MPDDLPLIYLARHCKTAWNLEQRIQGSVDMPLCEEGIAEAMTLIPFLRPYRFDYIVSSPFKRAFQTAGIYSKALDIPLETHPGLRELDHGRWEGQQIAILMRKGDRHYSDWIQNRAPVDIPQGSESLADATTRVVRALVDVAHKYPRKRVLIVLHKHIRAILNCHLHGCDHRAFGDFVEETIKPQSIDASHLRRVLTG